jgi:hypothetical protein
VIWLAVLVLAQDPKIEVELRAASVQPKFRLRDGETSLQGDSVFSDELDAEDDVFSPGGSVALRLGSERFHVEAWRLAAEGEGALEAPKAWGGAALPAGTPSDTDVRFAHVELGWRHRFDLAEFAWIDAGVDLEWLVVDADLGFGATRIGGFFPAPQVSASAAPWPWLEVWAGIGGFFLPFKSGDTSNLDPIQYLLGVRGRWDRFSAGVGYELYHVHLEENSGKTEEDVVHLRLRGIVFTLEARF